MHHAIAVPSQRVGTSQHLEVIENNFGNYDSLLLPFGDDVFSETQISKKRLVKKD